MKYRNVFGSVWKERYADLLLRVIAYFGFDKRYLASAMAKIISI